MKKRVIKLTENDVLSIVKKILNEQEENGLGPFPMKKEVPKMVSPTNQVKVKYGTPESVLKAKGIVKKHLMMSKDAMQQLTDMSGVNPEINGIVPDIEKVIEKFNNLYGEPENFEEKE